MARTEQQASGEFQRLSAARDAQVPWRKWGPYLSERQWGTVREDYSDSGDAWSHFSHDQARSRAYRWGEDGLAGISDDKQQLCFALALWNGRDPIIKERLFGLTNSEGNHGEDVKEYYFYLDSTPTHSYMKYLYKYPQSAYPYEDLVSTNRNRSRNELEYELLDTGVFDGDRYCDVVVEYAKASPEELIQITVSNRGSDAATLHVLPTVWFRNEWSWGGDAPRPSVEQIGIGTIGASHPALGKRYLHADGAPEWLFTENETNTERLGQGPNRTPYVKDGINNYIVHGQHGAVNPDKRGTKASAHNPLTVEPGASQVIRLRLSAAVPSADAPGASHPGPFGTRFNTVFEERKREADEFYAAVIPSTLDADATNVMRQAIAGMLWSKQFYNYDVNTWLSERGSDPFKPKRRAAPRNDRWHHMQNTDIISMPDKWEYPWYAAWDLAFHVLALTLVDEDFGKQQLDLMLQERYIHPSGQIPAYEWNFGDVNPPVHAWSTIFTYRLEKTRRGRGDIDWLERSFHKLLLNFTWWVNQKDRTGNNVFEGGFLGLDNIGVFDRSAPLPTGGYLEQADGTAWMTLFCQNMLEICTQLALEKPAYADMCLKFVEHYLWIASSMVHAGEDVGMWDEEDGFFYDVLRLPDGRSERLKVRSMVGLLPFCAVTVFEGDVLKKFPELIPRFHRFLSVRPELTAFIQDPAKRGEGGRQLASILNETKLRRVLNRMLDEQEFLSPYGIRSISRDHASHPYVFRVANQDYAVSYLPAESDSGMFGGNSNWRGPIWMPVNGLIIRALLQYYMYYGDSFTVECPTGSGRQMTLYEIAEEIGGRLARIFTRDSDGRRPVYGGARKFQDDPHWRDLMLFYEYFHGDNGAGLGASHQTGWTGIVARTMHLFATTTAEQVLELGKAVAAKETRRAAGAS
jgi:Glycosyl hydrolase family 63 C-terminal domain